jgi:hypothetical protein
MEKLSGEKAGRCCRALARRHRVDMVDGRWTFTGTTATTCSASAAP